MTWRGNWSGGHGANAHTQQVVEMLDQACSACGGRTV